MQIRANSADGVVVLDELAWVRGADGDVSLYIGHVSRLIRFLHHPAARNRFPPVVEQALHAAEETHDAWRREVEALIDADSLDAIEAPVRIVLNSSGEVLLAEHVFGSSWEQLRCALRRLGARTAPVGDQGASEDGRTSIEQFVQACDHAASWLRVPFAAGHQRSGDAWPAETTNRATG